MLMLEEIRAQNSATIDAVHASTRKIREDIRRHELRAVVVALKGAMERVQGKVDCKPDLARIETLERRVATLESAHS
jgi:hypothetical protein